MGGLILSEELMGGRVGGGDGEKVAGVGGWDCYGK